MFDVGVRMKDITTQNNYNVRLDLSTANNTYDVRVCVLCLRKNDTKTCGVNENMSCMNTSSAV